jgi:hypothetical protein
VFDPGKSIQEANGDPVLRALLAAPVDDEPVTPADDAALAEAEEDIRQGRVMPTAELRRRLGLPARG